MAVYREDMMDVDLAKEQLQKSFMCIGLGEGDQYANKFGIRCFRNGIPVDLTGATVNGYFIRADGVTIVLSGTASGNTAQVTLPETCYAVAGAFSLAIKVISGAEAGTMRIVYGTVIDTSSDLISDPSSIIPSLAELLAVIGRAEDAAADIAAFSITEQLIDGTDYRLIIEVEE